MEIIMRYKIFFERINNKNQINFEIFEKLC